MTTKLATNFAVPGGASRAQLVDRLSGLRDDPKFRTKTYEEWDHCITGSGSETFDRYLTKKFANKLEANDTQTHTPPNAGDTKPGNINFDDIKKLLANALILHDLKASKSNPMAFKNSMARTAEEKHDTPGYHSVEFVGGLASSDLYRAYIVHLTACVGYAYSHDQICDELVLPTPHAWDPVTSMMREIEVLSVKIGGINRCRAMQFVKACMHEVHHGIYNDWAKTRVICAAVDQHLKTLRHRTEDCASSTEIERKFVLNSLPRSEDSRRPSLTMCKRNIDEISDDADTLVDSVEALNFNGIS
jgi:hypothetical protein